MASHAAVITNQCINPEHWRSYYNSAAAALIKIIAEVVEYTSSATNY